MESEVMSDLVERARNRNAPYGLLALVDELAGEVEQLRERNNVLEIAHRQTHKTLDNAYAEIEHLDDQIQTLLRENEQLRAENRQLSDHWSDIAYERNDLKAEIKRLREVRCGHQQMAMGDLIGVCEFCGVLQAEIERLREQLRLYGSWPSTPRAEP